METRTLGWLTVARNAGCLVYGIDPRAVSTIGSATLKAGVVSYSSEVGEARKSFCDEWVSFKRGHRSINQITLPVVEVIMRIFDLFKVFIVGPGMATLPRVDESLDRVDEFRVGLSSSLFVIPLLRLQHLSVTTHDLWPCHRSRQSCNGVVPCVPPR